MCLLNSYELQKVGTKIDILEGNITDMSKGTQLYMQRNPMPDSVFTVNKSDFIAAIKEYKGSYEGGNYQLLNFPAVNVHKYNCIGFKNYVLEKSEIHR